MHHLTPFSPIGSFDKVLYEGDFYPVIGLEILCHIRATFLLRSKIGFEVIKTPDSVGVSKHAANQEIDSAQTQALKAVLTDNPANHRSDASSAR